MSATPRTLLLCCASGEGSHEFRICETEEAVYAFYTEMCGHDADGTIDGFKESYADKDRYWANEGTHFHLDLYCAEFDVWIVDAKQLVNENELAAAEAFAECARICRDLAGQYELTHSIEVATECAEEIERAGGVK
jgi:hypothetical protein